MKRWDELKAEDVMTSPVITLNSDVVLREAAQILSDEKISGALVNDHRGVPIGVISLFDIASTLAGFDRPAGEPGGFYRQSYPAFPEDEEEWKAREAERETEDNPMSETTVGEIMAADIIKVEPATSLVRVADLMYRRKIHRVFVSGQEGPVGVISSMDLLAVMAGKEKKAKSGA